MKPKELFSLSVRILGLVFLYLGLRAIPSALGSICVLLGLAGPVGGGSAVMVGLLSAVVSVVWPCWLASWLIGGAPLVMRTAFPDEGAGT